MVGCVEKRIGFTVRLPEALYEKLRQRAYEGRKSFQEAAQEAIETWLGAGQPPAGPLGELKPQELSFLRLALDLYRNGPADLVRIATEFLRYWAKRKKSSG